MLKLPVEFNSSASSGHSLEPWLVTSGAESTSCSIPLEFGGPGAGFSPEDLFLQSLINCFIGTFKVYAQGSKIHFSRVDVAGSLMVGQNLQGNVRMQTCYLKIEIFEVERPDRVKALVEKVFRDGYILNSVKTEISHDLAIHSLESEPNSII